MHEQQDASPPGEESIEERAKKKVEEKVRLLQHIGTYVAVNCFLVIVWALSGRGYPWFLWVMAGWGLGLAAHAIGYFVGSRSQAVRDKMIEKEIERQKKGPQ